MRKYRKSQLIQKRTIYLFDMYLLLLTIFAFAFAEWYAEYDFKEYTQGYILEHWPRAIIRFIVLLASSAWTVWLSEHELTAIDIILYVGYSCSVFWLWFEFRFSYMLDEYDPFYIGKTAWSDRFFRKLGISGVQLFYFKIALVISILITIFAT